MSARRTKKNEETQSSTEPSRSRRQNQPSEDVDEEEVVRAVPPSKATASAKTAAPKEEALPRGKANNTSKPAATAPAPAASASKATGKTATATKPAAKPTPAKPAEEKSTNKTTKKPEEEPAKTTKPSAANAKPKKKPTPEELRKKFLTDFAKLHKNCKQNSTFLKIWNPKNPLTFGGMGKRLKDNQMHSGDDELVYSIEMATTGTRADFDVLFEEPSIKEWMEANDIDPVEVIENFITYENFEERKDSEEIKKLQNAKEKVHKILADRLELVEAHFKKNKNVSSMTKQEKIIASFDEYREKDRVYDVGAWNSHSNHGYKSVKHPSANSKKHCMTTYPICSIDEMRMREFLEYLELDPDLANEAFEKK